MKRTDSSCSLASSQGGRSNTRMTFSTLAQEYLTRLAVAHEQGVAQATDALRNRVASLEAELADHREAAIRSAAILHMEPLEEANGIRSTCSDNLVLPHTDSEKEKPPPQEQTSFNGARLLPAQSPQESTNTTINIMPSAPVSLSSGSKLGLLQKDPSRVSFPDASRASSMSGATDTDSPVRDYTGGRPLRSGSQASGVSGLSGAPSEQGQAQGLMRGSLKRIPSSSQLSAKTSNLLGRIRGSIANSSRVFDDSKVHEEENFNGINPAWFQRSLRPSKSRKFGSDVLNLSNSHLGRGWTDLATRSELDRGCLCNFLHRHVARPGSSKRMTWDSLGMFFLLYDLIYIPLQAFEPEEVFMTEFLTMAGKLYWALDIPSCFFVGYYTSDGILEVRLRKIVQHYSRTWLLFDIVIVSVDWAVSVGQVVRSAAGETGTAYVRVLRLLRFMRLFRLLRLVKSQSVITEVVDRVTSETLLILLGILKLIGFIMMMNHLVACTWYGIGTTQLKRGENWIEDNRLVGKTLTYSYFTSLHWSLTQFTPASMEVVPKNSYERMYAVFVLVLAMVTFSSFISSITNAMTRLRNLQSEQMDRDAKLRRYLYENKVSIAMMCRVWKCLQTIMGKTKARLHEKDVITIKLLPYSLRADLLEEVYSPLVTQHPLFMRLFQDVHAGLRKIFQYAIEEVSLNVGHDLFLSGETGDSLYFMRGGEAYYKPATGRMMESEAIHAEGEWIAEPSVWISNWVYVGTFTASTQCECIRLPAPKLQNVLAGNTGVLTYAKTFAGYYKENPDSVNDCWADTNIIDDWVTKAFREDNSDDEDVMHQSTTDEDPVARTGTNGFMVGSSGAIFSMLQRVKGRLGSKASVQPINLKALGVNTSSYQSRLPQMVSENSEAELDNKFYFDGDISASMQAAPSD